MGDEPHRPDGVPNRAARRTGIRRRAVGVGKRRLHRERPRVENGNSLPDGEHGDGFGRGRAEKRRRLPPQAGRQRIAQPLARGVGVWGRRNDDPRPLSARKRTLFRRTARRSSRQGQFADDSENEITADTHGLTAIFMGDTTRPFNMRLETHHDDFKKFEQQAKGVQN